VLIVIDVVNVMTAYQPVVQACGTQWMMDDQQYQSTFIVPQ
jgi:hypothetical protein